MSWLFNWHSYTILELAIRGLQLCFLSGDDDRLFFQVFEQAFASAFNKKFAQRTFLSGAIWKREIRLLNILSIDAVSRRL
jgi:hypothetical protein